MASPGDRISGEQAELAIKCLRAVRLNRQGHGPEHIAGALGLPTARHGRHAVWLGEKLGSFDLDAAKGADVDLSLSPEQVRTIVGQIQRSLIEQARSVRKLKEGGDSDNTAPEA